jgi:hypothetical protein
MSCCSDHKPTAAPAFSGGCDHDLTDCGSTLYITPMHCEDHITPQNGCCGHSDCAPVPDPPLLAREYRLCVDQNGCATRYPADCRNPFWPNFSHPRWLPCSNLYCGRKECRCRKMR